MKIIFILILIAAFIQADATVRYVSKTGSSTPPYTSWETAADSIQKCINISQFGDTIYVANGVYAETIVVNRSITLIGSSLDSTVIDGTDLPLYKTVEFTAVGSMSYFWIKGQGIQYEGSTSVLSLFTNFSIKDCKISNAYYAVFTGYSSPLISKCFISDIKQAIVSPCFPDTCKVVVDSCIIIKKLYEPAMHLTYGSPTITNNIIFQENNEAPTGIYIDATTRYAIIKNNLISGFLWRNVTTSFIADSVLIHNNVISYLGQSNFTLGAIEINAYYEKVSIRNNAIVNNYKGINSRSLSSDYNLFWQNEINFIGGVTFGDSDIVADPMFVKDTIPTSDFNYDFHLQQYSPAIDKGDPEILDKDKTRSDIGMYGGLFGETYTYQDLAPLAPRNLSAVVDTNKILLKWNRNTEADTSYYKVYRDTVINFIIDSTKLISSQTDTFFMQLPPHKSSKLVYKITCVDKQGNESKPGEEVVVDLTSVSIDDLPVTINDYLLYQNYPNPFNPSTTIGYKLKERAYVKLMVYDIKGELISVLVNKEQSAGYYEAEFSVSSSQSSVGNDLASGIYLYRIEVIGDGRIPVYTEMKKMLMLK